MSKRIDDAILANKEIPYLPNHEIVFELVELNKKVTDLQNAISVLLSSEKPVAPAAAFSAPEPPVVSPVEATDSTEKE